MAADDTASRREAAAGARATEPEALCGVGDGETFDEDIVDQLLVDWVEKGDGLAQIDRVDQIGGEVDIAGQGRFTVLGDGLENDVLATGTQGAVGVGVQTGTAAGLDPLAAMEVVAAVFDGDGRKDLRLVRRHDVLGVAKELNGDQLGDVVGVGSMTRF